MAEGHDLQNEQQYPQKDIDRFKELRGAIRTGISTVEDNLEKGGVSPDVLPQKAKRKLAVSLVREQEKTKDAERKATIDILTGLPNRGFFIEHVNREIEQVNRNPDQFGHRLAISDLDDFGRFNKKYGISVGDEALIKYGRSMRGSVRATDVVARWGGEENVVGLSFLKNQDTSYDGTPLTLDRMREKIEQTADLPENITASIGTTAYIPFESFTNYFYRANLGQRFAKLFGKNRVVNVSELDDGTLTLHDLRSNQFYEYSKETGNEIIRNTDNNTKYKVDTSEDNKQILLPIVQN